MSDDVNRAPHEECARSGTNRETHYLSRDGEVRDEPGGRQRVTDLERLLGWLTRK